MGQNSAWTGRPSSFWFLVSGFQMMRTIAAVALLLACSAPPGASEHPAGPATQKLSHPETQPSATQQPRNPATTYDLLITNGFVIDGTGAPRRRADVGINGDTIAAIGDLSHATAKVTLDGHGDVVTPGFIDLLG